MAVSQNSKRGEKGGMEAFQKGGRSIQTFSKNQERKWAGKKTGGVIGEERKKHGGGKRGTERRTS